VWLHVTTDGQDKAHIWTPEYRVLVEVLNTVRWLQWSRTKDAQEGKGSPPAPVLPPEVRRKSEGVFTASAEEYARIMSEIEQNGTNAGGDC
jgi:hypothetical protein